MNKHLWAFIPFLYSKSGGHWYVYNKAVESALRKAGWNYSAFVSKRHIIDDLESHWQPLLDDALQILPVSGRRRLGTIEKTLNLYRLFRSFRKSLQQIGGGILFMEEFRLRQLKMLYWALKTKKISFDKLFLLHRYPPEWYEGFRGYQKHLRRVQKLLQEKLVLVADSEILAVEQSGYFGQKVFVLPIPHTVLVEANPEKQRLWWPGSARKEKGLEIMRRLASEKPDDMTLVVSESVRSILGDKPFYVPEELQEEAYFEEMRRAQFVLLPYDQHHYRASTSGIFIEAVTAGSIPLVTAGTWMAYELKRFDLEELIFDWKNPDIWQKIRALAESPKLKERLMAMSQSYKNFHNKGSFAESLMQLT